LLGNYVGKLEGHKRELFQFIRFDDNDSSQIQIDDSLKPNGSNV